MNIPRTPLKNPIESKTINGVQFLLWSSIEDSNPFVQKTYDYDDFYRWKFHFVNELVDDNVELLGTPEEFGRMKIIKEILELLTSGISIMDLWCGSLNIQRSLIEQAKFHTLDALFFNADISWPRFNPNDNSTLVEGTKFLPDTVKRNTTNIQVDLNNSILNGNIFNGEVFDVIASCMALHHINFHMKDLVLTNILNSLKDWGNLVIVDYFLPELNNDMVTNVWEKWPKECSGYGESRNTFIDRVLKEWLKLKSMYQINKCLRFISFTK